MKRSMKNAPRLMVLLSALACGAGSAVACGFHGGIQGGFSGVYPGSIIVASSIADAREKKLLPAALPQTIFGLHRALADLEAFKGALEKGLKARPAGQQIDFSVVLISSGLWSAFSVEGTRVSAKYHVSTGDAGKPVVITDAAVLRAIENKTLDLSQAVQLGLVAVRNDASGAVSMLVSSASS